MKGSPVGGIKLVSKKPKIWTTYSLVSGHTHNASPRIPFLRALTSLSMHSGVIYLFPPNLNNLQAIAFIVPCTISRNCRFSMLGKKSRGKMSFHMHHIRLPIIVALFSFIFVSAGVSQTAKITSPAEATPGKFTDITAALGVHFEYQASHTSRKYLLETMGAGVALFD